MRKTAATEMKPSPAGMDPGRWARPAGYRDVLRLALPLVVSTGSWSVQHFVDRMFLCWYAPEAMAAALPAGILAFTLISFFLGTATYVNTFVAQYTGAGRKHRVGPSVWQGVYFSLIAGLLLTLLAPFAGWAFRLVGHDAAIQGMERVYFRILILGSGFTILNGAVSSFFTGLGRNWPVMWVNVGVTCVNLLLDYVLIFGRWGFPAWGIAGAAWATIIANGTGAAAFALLFLSGRNQRDYATRSGWRFQRDLFGRLMRFGLPSGAQFMLDVLAFTIFVLIVGRIGTVELAATNVAFQINTLAFMPMIGFGIATSTLVGQWLGSGRPDLAARATWSSFHLTFGYMTTIAVLYVAVPSIFIEPFAAGADAAAFSEVRPLAVTILYFVAAYSVFDTMNVIFASALKGAGDTRFVMCLSVGLGWCLMVLPTWFLCEHGSGGIYTAWTFLSLYVITVGFGFLLRFLQGKWMEMRVTERPSVPAVPSIIPETPTTEIDL